MNAKQSHFKQNILWTPCSSRAVHNVNTCLEGDTMTTQSFVVFPVALQSQTPVSLFDKVDDWNTSRESKSTQRHTKDTVFGCGNAFQCCWCWCFLQWSSRRVDQRVVLEIQRWHIPSRWGLTWSTSLIQTHPVIHTTDNKEPVFLWFLDLAGWVRDEHLLGVLFFFCRKGDSGTTLTCL